jgi:uncharacterized membrane protein
LHPARQAFTRKLWFGRHGWLGENNHDSVIWITWARFFFGRAAFLADFGGQADASLC